MPGPSVLRYLRTVLLAVLTLAAPAGVQSVLAADLYVATSGDDSHAGTADQPLRTLRAAQVRVRKLLAERPRSITVEIGEGTYFLEQPLEFTTQDSVPAGHTVTYAGTPGKQVVLSGGQSVTLAADKPGRAKAQLDLTAWNGSRPRELYLSGQRATRCREPNQGYFRIVKAGPDDRTSFQYDAADLEKLGDLAGAELVFLHDWSITRLAIERMDNTAKVLHFADPIGCSAPHYRISHFEPQPRYALEDHPALLDAPGEWHLDSAGVLQYVLREGEAAEALQAVVPRLAVLLVIRGDEASGEPVRGLRFVNLQFQHAHWAAPQHGYASGQACFGEDRDNPANRGLRLPVTSAIQADLASDCQWENCRFANLAGSGVWLRTRCENNALVGCTIENVGGNAVMIGETFTRQANVGGQQVEQVATGNKITRSRILNTGQMDYGAVGVWIGHAQKTVVEHCELANLPYTGVSVGWVWNPTPSGCRENLIRLNHIHHVMQVLSDGGGIYTLGLQPGTVLEQNHIHDVPLNAGRAQSNGIFMDEGSSEILVDNNTIYNIAKSPIRFHRAVGDTLRNNRLVSQPGVPTFTYNAADPATMTFENNTELSAATWQPPADDPARSAGPGE